MLDKATATAAAGGARRRRDFFMRLHHDEALAAAAVELHLERLAAAAPDERLKPDVGFEVGNEIPGPRDGGLRVGEHGRVPGRHDERQGLAMAQNRDEALPLELDVEQAAGDDGRELLHHGDLVGDARLEGQQVVAVHDNGLALEEEHRDALAIVREVELRARLGAGFHEAGALARERLLQHVAETVVHHALALELAVALVSHHGARLDPHLVEDSARGARRPEVHLQEALLHHLERRPLLLLLVARIRQELLQRTRHC
jgi:hypothetical protein